MPQCRLPTAPGVCALGWVKCREHISLLVILCRIVYVTNKAHLSLIIIIVIILHSCKVDNILLHLLSCCKTSGHTWQGDWVWDISLTNWSRQRKSMRPLSCLVFQYHLSEILYFMHVQCIDLNIWMIWKEHFLMFQSGWETFGKCKWTFWNENSSENVKSKAGTLFNPSVFDWMKADLHVSLTVRKRKGLRTKWLEKSRDNSVISTKDQVMTFQLKITI